MQRNLSVVVRSAVCLILALGFAAKAQEQAKKIDPTGTWKWSITTPDGQTRESTLTLKLEGDKLTGTISGRGGDTPIAEAALKGDDISFQAIREFGGNRRTNKYSGKISGDAIKGKTEFVNRDGEAQSRDWDAKREAAKPKEEAKPAEPAKPKEGEAK